MPAELESPAETAVRRDIFPAMMTAMADSPDNRLRRVASRQNASVKELRRIFTDADPSEGLVAIEGVRLIEEAIRSGLRFQTVFFSDKGITLAERLLPQISQHTEALLLPDDVFASAVATETPQGVAALIQLKPARLENLLDSANGNALLVCVAGLQDPGNLGTIIRSAEAFGARAVLLGENTVSSANPKAVRASAGSIFRQPLVTVKLAQAMPLMKERNFRIMASSSHKGKPADEVTLTGAIVLLIGNEGAGLPSAILSQADELITIPQSARVESLNAGIAASILLYEAARQRRSP